MRVVVAMDSFKGTLSAPQACEAVRRGFLGRCSELVVATVAMADGGEGTAQALAAARGGEWIQERVMGPLPEMEVEAGYAWLARDSTAVVEMASASGLPLLKADRRDPLRTTTYGTGQLLRAAAARGPERLWLAVGGSATIDGGVGAAAALGWRFLDAEGALVGLGGGELERIERIEAPAALSLPGIVALCDVDHRLCGEAGAARTFGAQKGATGAAIERLDRGLCHLARLVAEQLGKEVDQVRGGGAGGGFGAGALAFLDAGLVPGVEAVAQAQGLAELLVGADWVITGEGCLDESSLRGKVVSGVVELGRQMGVEVGVIVGRVELAHDLLPDVEIEAAESAPGGHSGQPFPCAEELLVAAAQRFAQRHLAA